ncbi:MAG: hypothetical protein AAFN78_00975 [Pseudomonadota bacterium]
MPEQVTRLIATDAKPPKRDDGAMLESEHHQLVNWFEDSHDMNEQWDELAREARDYVDHIQWTSPEVAELKRRGQPVITNNLIYDKVQALIGLMTQNSTAAKAFPRRPEKQDDADTVTDILAYVRDINQYDEQIRPELAASFIIEGTALPVLSVLDHGNGEPEVNLAWVPYDRAFWDPHSRKPDYSDARYMGIALWMDRDVAEDLYPDKKDVIDQAFAMSSHGKFEDRPSTWVARKPRERVMIVEIYWRTRNGAMSATITRGGFIQEPMESPYKDENGRGYIPYPWQSAHVSREGGRYGVVQRYKDMQDEVNKRRSKALHFISMNQTIREDGAVNDPAEMRRQVNKVDGDIVVNRGFRFEIARNLELAAAQTAMLQHAEAQLSNVGPTDALLGQAPGSASGRKTQIDQQAGLVQLSHQISRFKAMELRIARMSWWMARQFYTREKFIRIRTGDTNDVRFRALNQVVAGPAGPQIINQLPQMDVDVIVEESPDYVNLQAEQLATMVQLAPAVQFPPEMYIEMSPLRSDVKERWKKMVQGDPNDPRNQQIAQLQEALNQLQFQQQVDETRKLSAEADEQEAKANLTEAEAEAQNIENLMVALGIRAP